MPYLALAAALLIFLGIAAFALRHVAFGEDDKRMREDLKKALEAGESGKLSDFLAVWGDKVPARMLKQVEQRKKELVRPTAWDKLNQD